MLGLPLREVKPLKPLSKKQRECILKLVYEDKYQKDIAEEIGISEHTFYEWKKNPLFMEEWEKEKERFLSEIGNKAIRRINELMDSNNDNVALGAAKVAIDKMYADKKEIDMNPGISVTVSYGE